jgi:hypothetical protein
MAALPASKASDWKYEARMLAQVYDTIKKARAGHSQNCPCVLCLALRSLGAARVAVEALADGWDQYPFMEDVFEPTGDGPYRERR